jgi:hypothetical protein
LFWPAARQISFAVLVDKYKCGCLERRDNTMQCAFFKSCAGMPLSGADITSENTSSAAFNRWAGSDAPESSGAIANVASKSFHLSPLDSRSIGAGGPPTLLFVWAHSCSNWLPKESTNMLWTICIILLVLWALGMVTAYTMGGLIHLLLAVAVVVLVIRLIQGRSIA